MDQALDLVTQWLLCASSQIGEEYFQPPVAVAEEPEYRERVYCYELYHRWRCHWLERFRFSLNGEVDKRGHLLIPGNYKPDFLVHIPGEMINLLVMEVKQWDADIGRMVDDLKKLTIFRRDLVDEDHEPANYHAAYFWVYGTSHERWLELRDELLRAVEDNPRVDCSLITCYLHQTSGAHALRVDWE